MPKMTFDDWVRSKKSAISKVASQRHETYEEVLAAMDYAWYNGQENVGQHFRTQCPHFGDMEKDDPMFFKLGQSAFYHGKQNRVNSPD